MKPIDPAWWAALQARAARPPRRPRVPLWVGSDQPVQIGTVEPDFLHQIGQKAFNDNGLLLQKLEHDGCAGWCVDGPVTAALNRLARMLADAGLAGAWRDEQLAVCDAQGRRLGTIERAAVRPLGITTHAVHLVGLAADGRVWVQQRAFNKANDPGLWDTLMGGMVGADDTLALALARETWEEAGLRVDDLQGLRYGGHVQLAGPSRDGAGAGYVTERIDWYMATVPQGQVPQNQDGEVEQFACMDLPRLQQALLDHQFTTEAEGILCEALGEHLGLPYDAKLSPNAERVL